MRPFRSTRSEGISRSWYLSDVDPRLGTRMFMLCSNGMIRRNVLAIPDFSRSPRLIRIAPKWIATWQSEREERGGAEIQAAGRDVGLSHARLVAAKSNCEPARGVKGSWRFHHSPNYSC